MRGTNKFLIVFATAALFAACGGSGPPATTPEPAPPEPSPPASVTPPASASSEASEEAPGAKQDKPDEGDKPKPAAAEVPDPPFKEGSSVDDAINAVPQGVERVNIDQETLGKPLANADVYAPCKPRANEHFKLRVAVWDGRAVGVDVKATPANKKLEECIKTQVRTLKWQDHVKALNTVDYAF